MNCYIFVDAPEKIGYVELVDYCCAVASKMLLVVRDPEQDSGSNIREILTRLEPFNLQTVLTNQWPGTVLYGHKATVYWFRVCPELGDELKSLKSGLFDWVHPNAPEDLCFLDKDGEPILVSISHERDAYLLLAEEQRNVIELEYPRLGKNLLEEG